jgi:acetyl-CoA carboxylase carboxyltransferase component
VTGKAFGGAYVMMGSRALGADVVFAWPNASIGAMDAKQAAKIVAEGADQREAAKKFAELQNNVASAAARGYVDTVIEEADTRKYVIGAFEMLYTKKENRPLKKHGTI